ncbi:MAG: site-specific integrase [Candidatus Cybelea sp.]
MGSVKRLRDKVYRIVYDVPSTIRKRKQKRETLYNVTKSEAEETLAKRKEKAKHRQGLRNPDITVAELFGEFFEVKRRTLSASGFERYEGMFRNYIGPAIGKARVSDLRPQHLIDTYARWSAKGVSGKALSGRTVHHLHDLLRCALNFGVRREWITRNIADCLETDDIPKAAKPEPMALNEAEMAALLNAARHPSERAKRCGGPSAEPWFHPAVAFAIYTGARRGEVLGLHWSDVDFESNSVTIRRSLTRTHSRGLFFKEPKNGKARTITMPATLATILKQHREAQENERSILGAGYKNDGLVFARPDEWLVNPRCFGNRVIELAVRAKITPITAHCLRDTHASLLAKKGVPLEVVSKRLGHADIRITAERYLHVYRESDAAAARVLDTVPSFDSAPTALRSG